MKAFSIFAAACLFYFLGKNLAFAFQNPSKNQTQNISDCRAEINRKIDSAMQLGDARGIALLLERLADFKNCLPEKDTALANLYHKTAVLCYVSDRYPEAIHWFGRALEIRENNPAAATEALLNTLNGLAQTHLHNFDFAKSEHFLERQLELLRQQKQPNLEHFADLHFAESDLAFSRRDLLRCRENLQLAIHFYQQCCPQNFNLASALNLSGIVADLLGTPAEALNFYRQSIPIFEKIEEPGDAARALHNLGIAFGKLAQPDSALFFLKKSAEIHRSIGDSVELARHFVEMARVFFNQNDLPAARDFAQRSLDLRVSLLPDWHPDVQESQVFLGQFLLKNGQDDAALQLFEQAIAAAARSPQPDQIIMPLSEKAKFFAKKGRNQPEFAQRAHLFFQKLDSLVNRARLDFRHDDSKIAFAQTVRSIYESAIANALHLWRLTDNPAMFEQALAFCENSKSAALRDHLWQRTAQGFAGLPDSVLEYEQRLRFRVGAAAEALLAAEKSAVSVRFQLQKNLQAAKNEQEEFNENLEKRFPKYFQLRYAPPKNTSMQVLQNRLPKRSLLVEFFVGDSGLTVLAVSDQRFEAWLLPQKQVIFENIRQFLQATEQQDGATVAGFCQSSRQVFRDILEKPLLHFFEKEGTERLFIVPDGSLAALPFDALLTDFSEKLDGDAPFLLKKYKTSVLFSHRLLLDPAPERRWFGRSDCSIFGIDYRDAPHFFSENFEKNSAPPPAVLPFSAEEIQTVERATGGEVFENRYATATHFLKKMGESRRLHVAAHGIFDLENPNLSGLLFSKNSPDDSLSNLVTVAEMYGLQTRAEFIFLSACNTGRGELIESEGVMSFARALTYAGAQSQVMTLWEVGDRSTGQIAERFYQHLHGGAAKDEALQLAKLDYLTACPTAVGQHPFFWAGAVVFGNSEPLFVPVVWKWAVAVGLGLLIVGFFFVFFKR